MAVKTALTRLEQQFITSVRVQSNTRKEVSTSSNESKTDSAFSSPEDYVENGCDVFDGFEDERGKETANMEDNKCKLAAFPMVTKEMWKICNGTSPKFL